MKTKAARKDLVIIIPEKLREDFLVFLDIALSNDVFKLSNPAYPFTESEKETLDFIAKLLYKHGFKAL